MAAALNIERLEDRTVPSTFTVTNLLDRGPDSLRAAVASANANPGPDAIDFATTGTITLTSGALDITDGLTISGPGVDALTVSGLGKGVPYSSSSSVIAISGSPTVSIANLTVTNGWALYGGGGIYMAGGTLTLDDCNVSGNYAGGYGGSSWFNGSGGGIYMAGGTLTLNQSRVGGNDAEVVGVIGGGGGIYMAGGTLALNQSTVSGNSAQGSSPWVYGAGGGLFVAGGTLTLDHSDVSHNSAVGSSADPYADYLGNPGGVAYGGGLYVTGDMVSINQSSVNDNLAAGGNGDGGDRGYGGEAAGGGIYVSGGTLGVRQSTFSGNTAAGGYGSGSENIFLPGGGGAAGGGIWSTGGALDVRQSTFSGNTAVGGYTLNSGDYSVPSVSEGGGLFTGTGAYLDTFTVDHTINNNPDNIVGAYFLDAVPRLAIGDVTVLEGNTGTTNFVFTVSLSAASDQPVTVAYATADGTARAGSDYAAAAGTLTIPAGQMTGTITVPVIGDRLAEPDESFVVNLRSPTGATVADGQGVGTIVDDEPRISITPSVSRSEGNTGQAPLAFAVTLSSAYDAPVTVAWGTADSTAAAGSDYRAASGTLTFAPGETSKIISVLVNGDRVPEPNETFAVNLSSPTNATVVTGQGMGTIVDDEPRISIGDVTRYEGKKNQTTQFTFTVTLSAAYDQAVTMSFGTADGTATTGDGDYVARSGTLTFAPGETSKTITIVVQGDSKRESDETFYLGLFGNSSNSLFTRNRGLGTIRNDD